MWHLKHFLENCRFRRKFQNEAFSSGCERGHLNCVIMTKVENFGNKQVKKIDSYYFN